MKRIWHELLLWAVACLLLAAAVLVITGCTVLERDFGDAMTINHGCVAEFEAGGTIDCTSEIERSRQDKGKDTHVETPNIPAAH